MTHQVVVMLTSGEVLASNIENWTDEELKQGKELFQDILGTSKGAYLSLHMNDDVIVVPAREIRFIRLRKVS